jgi:hypothetical protein
MFSCFSTHLRVRNALCKTEFFEKLKDSYASILECEHIQNIANFRDYIVDEMHPIKCITHPLHFKIAGASDPHLYERADVDGQWKDVGAVSFSYTWKPHLVPLHQPKIIDEVKSKKLQKAQNELMQLPGMSADINRENQKEIDETLDSTPQSFSWPTGGGFTKEMIHVWSKNFKQSDSKEGEAPLARTLDVDYHIRKQMPEQSNTELVASFKELIDVEGEQARVERLGLQPGKFVLCHPPKGDHTKFWIGEIIKDANGRCWSKGDEDVELVWYEEGATKAGEPNGFYTKARYEHDAKRVQKESCPVSRIFHSFTEFAKVGTKNKLHQDDLEVVESESNNNIRSVLNPKLNSKRRPVLQHALRGTSASNQYSESSARKAMNMQHGIVKVPVNNQTKKGVTATTVTSNVPTSTSGTKRKRSESDESSESESDQSSCNDSEEEN